MRRGYRQAAARRARGAGIIGGIRRNGATMRGGRGFTLVELAVVIAVLGVLFTILIGITRSVVIQQRYALTRARMANVDNALLAYVSQYRRLPCPADGSKASNAANAGAEVVTGTGTARDCGTQQNGVVAWAALGLSAADIEDGWGGRLTYRVGPDLAKDGAMDFTSCDPAGSLTTTINTTAPVPPWCIIAGPSPTQCNTGTITTLCTTPAVALTGSSAKGLVVENVAGAILADPRGSATAPPAPNPNQSFGAAYVLISHGAEGGGAFSSEGKLLASPVAAGTKEALNFANAAYVQPAALPAAPSAFLVDDVLNGNATAAHFDDLVSRPGILALAMKAQLGPRGH
jgi:prepilin-type N-terminal cleavage/methylation domain-containing protein